MKLMITCREAARLMSAELDRELPWLERVVLRGHLLICNACPNFRRQVRLMDQAMGRWRAYADRGE
jgi:predicted anti-sigma-YlaC factor YlaD